MLARRSFELPAASVGLPTASVCLSVVRPSPWFNLSRDFSGVLRVKKYTAKKQVGVGCLW